MTIDTAATEPKQAPTPPDGTSRGERLRNRLRTVDQGVLIAGVTVVMILVGAVVVDGMFTVSNFLTIARLASPLAILALASALVIMSKNLDLSVVAIVGIAGMGSYYFAVDRGYSEIVALLVVAAVAVAIGLLNGWLVAYVEIPALFVTLGTWKLFEGYFNENVFDKQYYTLPPDSDIVRWLGLSKVIGIPTPILVAAVVLFCAWAALKYTSWGQLLRATGDNPAAARLTGVPVRPMLVGIFVVSALLAWLTGLLLFGVNGGYSKSDGGGADLMFNAITAAVIGGVSLSGGKGNIFGVIAGTAFITVFVNMMTLLDVSVVTSSVIRGTILLAALALDAWLHPRDEETAKSDDL